MNNSESALIVPIAHYVGQAYDVGDQSMTYNLRGGWGVVKLSEDERLVWAFAHGDPDQLQKGRRWTRKALLEAVTGHVDEDRASHIVADLLDRQVLAEVSPRTEQAVDFASKYRLVPLQVGLGNTAEEPWAWRIGIGEQVLVSVSHNVYDAWEWCHLYRSLWDACRKLGKIRQEHTELTVKPEDLDPETILNEVVESLHGLLSVGCAYLDVPHEWGTP